MSLHQALERHGYTFRRHLEEEGWTQRKPTVVDLTEDQRSALARGGEAGLREALARDGLWTFPALDIQAPIPPVREVPLADGSCATATVAAPERVPSLWEAAGRFVAEVADRHGVRLTVSDDADLGFETLAKGDLVLFGGGHDSALARDLALRYQTFFVDASVPGAGGFAVTTHSGLDASGHSVVQVWADPGRADEAVDALLSATTREADRTAVRRVHRVALGPEARQGMPSWEEFAAGLPMGLPAHVGGPEKGVEDPVRLADQVAKGFDSGGPDVNHYNPGPIDTAISAAWYYLLSEDGRALALFRELLFRLADYYLKTPEGASYPADLDFRSGHLVLFWSRLEHEAVFSETDRLILANLLLAVSRSTHEYAAKMWPVAPNGRTRHNHETFPARSLMYAADYFRRYGVADTDAWQGYADTVFSGGIWTRAKQRENANHYEQTAYEHASCYSGYTGHRLSLFGDGVLKRAAVRHVRATDNFLRAVDYSDTAARLGPAGSDVLAVLAHMDTPDPELAWYAHEIHVRGGRTMGSPRNGIPGLRPADPGEAPPVGTWECVSLEPQFIEDFVDGFPEPQAFDKLAFRTGWGDADQYLLLEGVGGKGISHAHNEVNGLVRYNHLGRHLVVSNGYGRRAGVTNVRDSFSSRVLGPEDHNMLVLRRHGEAVETLPVCAALVQRSEAPGLAAATGLLAGYGGTDWFRTLVVAAGRFLLVIDRIHVVADDLEGAHVEWNALGDLIPGNAGCRLGQRGVWLDVSSPSGWDVAFDTSDRSADWQRLLEGDAYPYADFPLKKAIYRMPGTEAGSWHCLATLLAATPSAEPVWHIEQEGEGRYLVESRAEEFAEAVLSDGDLTVRASGRRLEVALAEQPAVPAEVARWAAGGSA